MMIDFHTHNLNAVPGTAIVNLPKEALLCPERFALLEGGLYSAGIHPWWTDDDLEQLWRGLSVWIEYPQVVAVGECGLDKLRGADAAVQEMAFLRQVELSERWSKPLTVHCVKAFDRLLAIHKKVHPTMQWTVHGFRGKPALAQQLLSAGLDLSFGVKYNEQSWAITPPDRRHQETDDIW